MEYDKLLEAIRTSDVDPSEARKAIVLILKSDNPDKFELVYEAFRSWTWITLDSRRRDDELRGWHDLLRKIEAYLTPHSRDIASKLQALSELIYESVRVGEALNPERILRRTHTREILFIVARSDTQKIGRKELAERLGLGQANLTRVLNMLVAAGLLQKEVSGKNAFFELTRRGIQTVSSLRTAPESATDQTSSSRSKTFAPRASIVIRSGLGAEFTATVKVLSSEIPAQLPAFTGPSALSFKSASGEHSIRTTRDQRFVSGYGFYRSDNKPGLDVLATRRSETLNG